MTADAWEPGGPWDAQSDVVKELVDCSRPPAVWQCDVADVRSNHPHKADLDQSIQKLDEGLIDLQRQAARPQPYRFEIKKVEK